MRLCLAAALSLLSLFLLPGCWDKAELTEFGYVQAVAIDLTEGGKVELTTQFYNPSGGAEMGEPAKQGNKAINIKTEADTVLEAVRDIPIRFGRKARFDQMRIILIGEQLARNQSVGEVLDFFARDHEPRGTVLMLIAKGKAGGYLEIKPFIEYTIGQQLRKIEESASKYSAKTSKVPLHDLAIELKSETGNAMVPYVYRNKKRNEVSVAGIALLKEGKMVDSIVTPTDTQKLLMLINKYQNGVLEFPCTDASKREKKAAESFDVISLDTKVTPKINGNEVIVKVLTKIKGTVGELRCSALKTKEDEKRFEENIKKTVERDLRKVIAFLQKEKMDVIGVGNHIYRKNPALWKSWKPTWDERFAEIQFEVDIGVTVLNTGMNAGSPFSK